jgi:putative inorganic carbon (HCO3(-)) transporter
MTALGSRETLLVLIALPAIALTGAVIAAPPVEGGGLAIAAAVVAAIAVAAALADPRIGLTLVVLSAGLPISASYGVRVHAAHLFIAAYAVRALVDWRLGNARLSRGILVPVTVVLFGAVLASIAGPKTGGSLFRLLDVFALPLVGGLAVAVLFEPRRDMRVLVAAMAVALALTSLVAILQAAGYTAGPLGPVEQDRANGLFEHPNALSGYLAPVIVLLTGVAAAAWGRLRLVPVALLVPVMLGVVALLLTLSRGALIGVAAGLLALIVLLAAQRRVAAALAAALLVVGALLVAVPQVPQSKRAELTQRLQRLFQPGTETGRALTYEQARLMIARYPLTGVGPLTFGKLTRESTPIPDIEPGREHAHSLFLEGYLSFGPLGLLALLWLLAGAGRRLLRAARAAPVGGGLAAGWAAGSLAALVVMLVQGLGDFVFSNIEPLTLMLLIVGAGYALDREREQALAR